MRVWVTKWALTSGIQSADDWLLSPNHRKFAHVSRDAALAHAEQMRLAKIASLQKQIAKLEKLSFA